MTAPGVSPSRSAYQEERVRGGILSRAGRRLHSRLVQPRRSAISLLGGIVVDFAKKMHWSVWVGTRRRPGEDERFAG